MSGTGFPLEVQAMASYRSGGLCEICGEGRVTEHHHRRPRGSGGSKRKDTNMVSNLLALCHACHQLTEQHRRVALLLGWLVRQRFSPAGQQVMYRGGWVWLTDDGQALPC